MHMLLFDEQPATLEGEGAGPWSVEIGNSGTR